jgi:hypothetical protein
MMYFQNDDCDICMMLLPKEEGMLKERFPQQKMLRINANQSLELARQQQLLCVPGILPCPDGHEYFPGNEKVHLGQPEDQIAPSII